VPAVTGACPTCGLPFCPTENNTAPGSFRERYG
jgi:hypothetical protein